MHAGVETETAVLITRSADRPAWVQLILDLDRLALSLGNVRLECDEEIAGDALLDGDAGTGVCASAVAKCGID